MPFLGLFSVHLFCPIPIGFLFDLFYYYPLEACFLLMKDRKGVDPEGKEGGEELGGAEEGETIIWVYLCEKKIYFQ